MTDKTFTLTIPQKHLTAITIVPCNEVDGCVVRNIPIRCVFDSMSKEDLVVLLDITEQYGDVKHFKTTEAEEQ